jgi:hypothetical protein
MPFGFGAIKIDKGAHFNERPGAAAIQGQNPERHNHLQLIGETAEKLPSLAVAINLEVVILS